MSAAAEAFSDDWDTEEPTWKERRYVPMAELVFGSPANDSTNEEDTQ